MPERRMGRPTIITNGRFSVSIETGRNEKTADFSDAGVSRRENIFSDSVKAQTNQLVKRKQSKPQGKNKERNENLKKFLSTVSELLVKDLQNDSADVRKGAGRWTLNKKEAESFFNYTHNLGPTVPLHDISDDDVEDVLRRMYHSLPDKSVFGKIVDRIAAKGAPSPNLENPARARAVLHSFLQCAGLSVVTGKQLKFSTAQLDHRVPTSMGGEDVPDNWIWMEGKYNQFKSALTSEALRTRIAKEIQMSSVERKGRNIEHAIQNLTRNTWANFFSARDKSSIRELVSKETLTKISQGSEGDQIIKALLNKFDVGYYEKIEGKNRVHGKEFSKERKLKLALQVLDYDTDVELKKRSKFLDDSVNPILEKLSSDTHEPEDVKAFKMGLEKIRRAKELKKTNKLSKKQIP